MDLIWQKFTEWLKELLISGIMDNVNGLFDNVNSRVAGIAGQVGATPQGWNSSIYGMIRTLSDNVILPIAGVILAFVMTLELIQLITEKNNMHDVDTWMFFKWIFKTACAVLIVTNTWNIVMGVFEAAQSVVNSASGIIISDTSLTFNEHIAGFEAALAEMEVWSLLGLWLESVVVHLSMWALTICIFIICYGRMIEIYCVTSIAPIPMATRALKICGQNTPPQRSSVSWPMPTACSRRRRPAPRKALCRTLRGQKSPSRISACPRGCSDDFEWPPRALWPCSAEKLLL